VGGTPEHRAGGVASQMMRFALEEAHRERTPLSVLFAATQPVYRGPGFEQAGVRLMYRLPTRGIDVRDRPLGIRPIQTADHHACVERAHATSANFDRRSRSRGDILPREIFRFLPDIYILYQMGGLNASPLRMRDWSKSASAA